MRNTIIAGGASIALAALLAASTVLGATPSSAAVTPMTPDGVPNYEEVRPQADYIKRVEMVPMRDGVKLYTVIVMKKGTKDGPILLSRTPYDAKHSAARIKSQSIEGRASLDCAERRTTTGLFALREITAEQSCHRAATRIE